MAGKESEDHRTIVAHHEAGHAVVAYDQGVRVHGISIVPDEVRSGHVRIDTLLLDRLAPTFRSDKGARNRFTMERHVMVLLGGYASVRQLDPSRRGLTTAMKICGGSDYATAMSLVNTFASREQETEKYFQWLEARTEGLVNSPMRWFQVQSLAEALLEHEKLGARRVREIIREAGIKWREKHSV